MVNTVDEGLEHIHDEIGEFYQAESDHLELLSDDQKKEGMRLLPVFLGERMIAGIRGYSHPEVDNADGDVLPELEGIDGDVIENRECGRTNRTSEVKHISNGIQRAFPLHNVRTSDFAYTFDPMFCMPNFAKRLLECLGKGPKLTVIKNARCLLPTNHLLRCGHGGVDVAFTRSVNFKKGRLHFRIYVGEFPNQHSSQVVIDEPVCILDVSTIDPGLKDSD